MTTNDPPVYELIQSFWQSNNPRDRGRQFMVEIVWPRRGTAGVLDTKTFRFTEIRLDRLRDSRSRRGYTLIR